MNRKIIGDATIFETIVREVNPSAACVYIAILGHRNGRTGECYLTQDTLATDLGMTDRTVRRNLTALKDGGYIDWKKGSSFSSKANSYIFPMESFDAEGTGVAIEAKKLKAKNKEEKIKANVAAKLNKEEYVREKITQVIGEAPTKEQLQAFMNMKKATQEDRIERNKAKAKNKKETNELVAVAKKAIRIINELRIEMGLNKAEYPELIKLAKDNKREEMAAFIDAQFWMNGRENMFNKDTLTFTC